MDRLIERLERASAAIDGQGDADQDIAGLLRDAACALRTVLGSGAGARDGQFDGYRLCGGEVFEDRLFLTAAAAEVARAGRSDGSFVLPLVRVDKATTANARTPTPAPDQAASHQAIAALQEGIDEWKRVAAASVELATEIATRAERTALNAARYLKLRDGNAFVPEEQNVIGGDALDELVDSLPPGYRWADE